MANMDSFGPVGPSKGWLLAVLSAVFGMAITGGVVYMTNPTAAPALDLTISNSPPGAPAAGYNRVFTSNGNLWIKYPSGFAKLVNGS